MTAWGEAHNTATLDAGLARIAAAIAAHRPRPLTFTAADGVVTCGRCAQRWGVEEFTRATLAAHKRWCR